MMKLLRRKQGSSRGMGWGWGSSNTILAHNRISKRSKSLDLPLLIVNSLTQSAFPLNSLNWPTITRRLWCERFKLFIQQNIWFKTILGRIDQYLRLYKDTTVGLSTEIILQILLLRVGLH